MLIPQNEGWRILLVDDDEEDYFLTRSMLREAEGRKIELDWAPSYSDGQRMLQAKPFHAVLVDYSLGERTGIELIRELVSSGYSTPMILLTGHGGYAVDVEAMQVGASLYLAKADTTPLLLERSIRYAIEQKRIEEELDRRYQERSDILESIKDGFIAVDRDWQITYINKRAANNGSSESEQLAGQNIWEAFPQLPGTDFEMNSRQVMDGRKPIQFDMQGAYPEQWYSFSLYPTADGISILWQNITERKWMEVAFRESEERYRHLFDHSFEGIILFELVYDEEGQVVDWILREANKKAAQYFPAPITEAIGRSFSELFGRDAMVEFFRISQEVMTSGVGRQSERFFGPTGTWQLSSIFPVGKNHCASGNIDITEYKQVEQKLRECEERLQIASNKIDKKIDIRGEFD